MRQGIPVVQILGTISYLCIESGSNLHRHFWRLYIIIYILLLLLRHQIPMHSGSLHSTLSGGHLKAIRTRPLTEGYAMIGRNNEFNPPKFFPMALVWKIPKGILKPWSAQYFYRWGVKAIVVVWEPINHYDPSGVHRYWQVTMFCWCWFSLR